MKEQLNALTDLVSTTPEQLITLAIEYSLNFCFAVLIFFVGRWLAGRVVAFASRLMRGQELDATVVGFIANILFVVLLVMVAIAALSQLGIPTASFIAVIGAAGLAIGLALQGSLSNFASGVLLVSLKPLRVGDYVEAGGTAGSVERISIFSTTLVAPDQRIITVPNSQILDGAIVNYSLAEERRLDLVVGISYDADIEQAKNVLREIVEADSRVIRGTRETQIGVLELADSSVKLALRPWVKNAEYWPLRFDLLEIIKRRFDEAGIGIPFPQRELHITRAQR